MITFWRLVYRVLIAAFVLTAVLNLLHVKAGFITNYLADVTLPALLYVLSREVVPGKQLWPHRLSRLVGRSPERAAILLFLASSATELSQIWWPKGFFAGKFDPLDIVAYGTGLAVCYGADKLQCISVHVADS